MLRCVAHATFISPSACLSVFHKHTLFAIKITCSEHPFNTKFFFVKAYTCKTPMMCLLSVSHQWALGYKLDTRTVNFMHDK